MNRTTTLTAAVCAATIVAAGTVTFAQSTRDVKKPSARNTTPPAAELPPGMTEADMMACMEAATPGPKHAYLTSTVGVWNGRTTMWMSADAEPTKSSCTSTITAMMDGRFTRCEVAGEMPGMGPFNGFGVYGYDNVAQKFQGTWMDNFGTGMMIGTGELSSDGKTLTWDYTFNCPIEKGPKKFREVQRRTGENAMTLEMYGPDPVTGREYKVFEIDFKRRSNYTSVDTNKQ